MADQDREETVMRFDFNIWITLCCRKSFYETTQSSYKANKVSSLIPDCHIYWFGNNWLLWTALRIYLLLSIFRFLRNICQSFNPLSRLFPPSSHSRNCFSFLGKLPFMLNFQFTPLVYIKLNRTCFSPWCAVVLFINSFHFHFTWEPIYAVVVERCGHSPCLSGIAGDQSPALIPAMGKSTRKMGTWAKEGWDEVLAGWICRHGCVKEIRSFLHLLVILHSNYS